MTKVKGDEIKVTRTLATSTLALIVTPALKAAALDRIARRRGHKKMVDEELHVTEVGEIDLGDIDDPPSQAQHPWS
jgi:hypothetical protein